MSPQTQVVAPRRSLETASVFSFIFTLAAAAFIFFPFSMPLLTMKTFVLAAGALVTLALYILARLSRGNIIFPPLTLMGALCLPALAYVLSAAFSGTTFASALWGTAMESDTLGFILIASILGVLASLIFRRSDQYRSFLNAGAWIFGIAAVLETLVIIIGQFSPVISPAFALVGSSNDLAFFLGLGIIGILIALRSLYLSPRSRRLLIGSSILGLFLLAVTNVKIVWVLLGLVSLGLFIETVMQRGPKTAFDDADDFSMPEDEPMEQEGKGRSLVMPLIVLAASLFFLVGNALGGAFANAFHINIVSVSPSWQATFAIAQKTYSSAPIFGTGPGTFGIDWLKYRDTSINSTIFWNTNFSSGVGLIPTSLTTTGIVGVLAWVAFFGFFIILGLRTLLLRTPADGYVRYVATFSFIAAFYLFAIAVFGLPSSFIFVLAFVFAGIFASSVRFSANREQWGIIFSRKPRIGFIIVFGLTIFLLSAVFAAYALSERYIAITQLRAADAAFSSGDLDTAEQAAKNSISFMPSATAYQIEAGIASTRLNQIAASTTMSTTAAQTAFQAALSAGINAALTATNLAPSDYRNWVALGNLYAQAVPLRVSGAYENAKMAYDKAIALNPTDPQMYYVLAQLNIANKDTKTAQEHLKSAIALKQDYTAAIFLLSQLEVQDGNVKDALSSALAAAYFTPDNPYILFQVGILYAAQNDFANAVTALEASVASDSNFANARYFLSAVYAKQGNMKDSFAQMQAIADMSADNAKSVEAQLKALKSGKNPFPANFLSAPSTPVKQ